MPSLLLTQLSQLVLAAAVFAAHRGNVRDGGGMQLGPVGTGSRASIAADDTNGWGTFDQLIDHANPDLGTFSQRYWYGTQYWDGPGSPVFLVNPGEQSADGFNETYTTLDRLPGLMAQATGGAVVVLEHRYWGGSSPFDNLTVENLQYLTLENSIRDNTYFANHFNAPFDPEGQSGPEDAPWVFTGGSYPGALAGWIAAKDPGTFWAYYGTSAVVEAIGDFWQYFEPVMEATPSNCSRDLNSVIEHIDATLLNGSSSEKADLKDKFMLGILEDGDFVAAIENGPWTWQSGQFYSATTSGYTPYYQFCDYVENVWPNSTYPVPDSEGVGLDKALDGYAKWFTEVNLPGYCEDTGLFNGTHNAYCFQMLNASNPLYHDLSPGNWINRQWNWMLCNEPFEYWQDGAPEGQTTIVSRLSNESYWRSLCPFFFPEPDYGIAQGKSAEDVNDYTGGWFVTNTTRLMYANGQWDPWRDVTVSSIFRPGGPLESTPELPVRVLSHGTHCSDLYGENWDVNDNARALADAEVANMQKWIDEFYVGET